MVFSSKIHIFGSPNLQFLRMEMELQKVVKLMWGWTLIQYERCLIETGHEDHAETADTVLRGRSMRRVSNRTRGRRLREEANPCWHRDLGLLASRTLRKMLADSTSLVPWIKTGGTNWCTSHLWHIRRTLEIFQQISSAHSIGWLDHTRMCQIVPCWSLNTDLPTKCLVWRKYGKGGCWNSQSEGRKLVYSLNTN